MQKIKIMIVEDEEAMAQSIRLCLENLNYQVTAIVNSGEDALEKAKETQPQLILMDILLSGTLNGVEAAKILFEQQKIPVIFLSGCADNKTIEQVKTSNAFGYIVKPFKEQELRIAIELALYKSQTQIKLKKKDQLLSTTLKSIVDAVIVADEKGSVIFLNRSAAQLTGWTIEEAIGKNLTSIFTALHPDETIVSYEELLSLIEKNRKSQSPEELLLVSKEKKRTAIESTIAPVNNENSNNAGVVLTFRDISPRKLLEEELLQSQKMDAVGRLAGGVAHDFNNLLTAIIGYSDLIINANDENKVEYPETVLIKKAAERAAELTEQLLAFSRKQTLNPKTINMNKIITNMQKLLQHAVGENIKFTTELHPNLTLTKIDAGQIQQTLLNLVINAKDAMPNGGKLVIRTYNTSEAAPESLPNKSLAKKEHIAIAITDTGCGMSKKVLDHLFEPFFSTKKQGERSGLGLSTAYGIIMQSNGLIDVKSAPNEGSTFTIYLPEAVTEEVTSPTQPAPATNTIETILLVEDEEMVRSLAEAILSRKGYNILSAENGEHALKLLKEYDGKINLLITDLIMPGIGGLKLAEKISTTHPETKLLFMSGYSEQNPLTEKKAFPDSGFLQKPFSLDQLTTKVMETINGTK